MSQPPTGDCRPRVLFVDDSKLMRLAAQRILDQDFDLHLAGSGEEALEQLRGEPDTQILFTDIIMTGMTGYELMEAVRGDPDPRLSEMPIIVMTGREDQESERETALKSGASDFIGKPFRPSELLARTRTHLKSEQLRRQLRALESSHPQDPQTGLGHRSACIERLEQTLSFSRRHGLSLSLVTLHLDGLAALTEDLGEPFGRQAWHRLGTLLEGSIRREDSVFRIGRESFCFLLPATEANGAAVLRDRFVPDLQSLGLDAEGQVLNVRCRFLISEPDPRLDHDLDALIDGEPDLATDPNRERKAPSLDEALSSLERGDIDTLKPHLDELRGRLEPLLELLSVEAAPVAITGND